MNIYNYISFVYHIAEIVQDNVIQNSSGLPGACRVPVLKGRKHWRQESEFTIKH